MIRTMYSLQKIRYTWLTLLVFLVGFLVYQAVVPFGTITYHHDFLSFNYQVSDLSPVERVVSQARFDNRVSGEPVYFYLRTPRPFRQAALTLTLSNPAPVVELGVCRDKTAWNFERQPVYIEGLEAVANNSQTLQESGVLLWQREKTYDSIEAFLQALPPTEKIATYNYQLPTNFRLTDYHAASQPRTIETGIRGSYIAVTYSGGESLDLTITLHKEEENKKHTASSLRWTIYNEHGEGIVSQELPMPLDFQPLIVKLSTTRLPVGPYRLEFKSDDTIITDTITTSQSKLAFINKLSLADIHRTNFTLFTDASYLKAQTLNPEHLQTLTIGQQSLPLSETYRQFSLPLDDQTRALKTINLPADDILLAGEGVFAFSADDSINPSVRSYNSEMNLDQAGIDYIIARYEPLGKTNSYTRTLTFTLDSSCLDKGGYPFVIAASGLNPDKPMTIEKVAVTLSGQTLKEFIQKLWTHQ